VDIEVIAYGLQNIYRLNNQDVDPQAIVFAVYRHEERTYFYMKAGKYPGVRRETRFSGNGVLPAEKQVEAALKQILTDENLTPPPRVKENKTPSLWNRSIDWLYSIAVPNNFHE